MSLVREDTLLGMGLDLAYCPYLAIRLGRPDVCLVVDAVPMLHLNTQSAPRSGYRKVFDHEMAEMRRTVEGHGLPADIMVTLDESHPFADFFHGIIGFPARSHKGTMTTFVCIPPGRVSPEGGAEVWEGSRDWPWAGVSGGSNRPPPAPPP
jgi:hypothetical protein